GGFSWSARTVQRPATELTTPLGAAPRPCKPGFPGLPALGGVDPLAWPLALGYAGLLGRHQQSPHPRASRYGRHPLPALLPRACRSPAAPVRGPPRRLPRRTVPAGGCRPLRLLL